MMSECLRVHALTSDLYLDLINHSARRDGVLLVEKVILLQQLRVVLKHKTNVIKLVTVNSRVAKQRRPD